MPFRVAPKDVLERTRAIEAELRAMAGSDGAAATADNLRVAPYAGAGSWTRVLDLASRMAPGEARSRALAAAAAGLRLDERTAGTLASRLGAEPKR
jgi:hypothetical protein